VENERCFLVEIDLGKGFLRDRFFTSMTRVSPVFERRITSPHAAPRLRLGVDCAKTPIALPGGQSLARREGEDGKKVLDVVGLPV